MFDSLAEKLQATLADVRGRGTLTEDDVNAAMREIRLALLEADVNFKVVKSFTNAVKERALGSDVVGQLNPGQQVVKIVNEELSELMGGASHELAELMGGESRELVFSPRPPTVILMAGLQGSGKTTATGKLARYLKEQHGSSVAVAACDVYRPAAVDQLVKVAAQVGADVYERGTDANPVEIAKWARERAEREGKDVLIVDTAGRLHVDEELMTELAEVKRVTRPTNVLLVVDAMTGQDAVNVAEQFAEVAQFDGVVMSKLDGDARGGAALSVKAVTGKPILFASTGEKLDQFERFHPDRMAQRILGMGDVLTFIEKAEQQFDEDQAKELERKIRKSEFGLDDFLDQLKQIRRLGPLQNLLGMIPGLGGHQLSRMKVDEREFDRIQAIILSMTLEERRNPDVIKGSRRIRIARGSGTNVQAVKALIRQFGQMQKLMKAMQQGKAPDLGALMRQAR
ncbi:MAG TPA: signal recognition particle protein [Conexibacter sp.]|nr:signal recognition particle protein [Conexibacter sp.]